MHKEVEALEKLPSQYEPADADHLYSAKVSYWLCESLYKCVGFSLSQG